MSAHSGQNHSLFVLQCFFFFFFFFLFYLFIYLFFFFFFYLYFFFFFFFFDTVEILTCNKGPMGCVNEEAGRVFSVRICPQGTPFTLLMRPVDLDSVQSMSRGLIEEDLKSILG